MIGQTLEENLYQKGKDANSIGQTHLEIPVPILLEEKCEAGEGELEQIGEPMSRQIEGGGHV